MNECYLERRHFNKNSAISEKEDAKLQLQRQLSTVDKAQDEKLMSTKKKF